MKRLFILLLAFSVILCGCVQKTSEDNDEKIETVSTTMPEVQETLSPTEATIKETSTLQTSPPTTIQAETQDGGTATHVSASEMEGKSMEEIMAQFTKAKFCSGCGFKPSTGAVSEVSKFNDCTKDILSVDNEGVTISEAAPTQILAVSLMNTGSAIRVMGKSGARFDQEMCLTIRADDDSDGIYEKLLETECWGTVSENHPVDYRTDVGDSRELLLYSTGSISIDFVGPDGIVLDE